ncbi:MAG: M48 family metallopeptidase [Verrucomicrobiales bacterium]
MNLAELRSRLLGESLPSEVVLPVGNRLTVRYLTKAGCRRYIMRLKGETLQITLPYRYTVAEIQKFLGSNLGWIEEQLLKQKQQPKEVETFGFGSKVLFRGEMTEVCRGAEGSNCFHFAGQSIQMHSSPEHLKYAVYDYMYGVALMELPHLAKQYAAKHGLKVSKVTIRNQKSRWGSCSSSGSLSLNWRLIQTPEHVRDYIIYHELMHLRFMNHSADFWNAVAEVFPDYPRAERWLKQHAGLLKS